MNSFKQGRRLASFSLNWNDYPKGSIIVPYKGYIVNQKAIRTIEPDRIIMQNGQLVPLAKRSFREIKDRFFDYIFGSGGSDEYFWPDILRGIVTSIMSSWFLLTLARPKY